MRFVVQATRSWTRVDGSTTWTDVVQLPTFWVEAINEANAKQIASAIIGVGISHHGVTNHVSVVTFD